MLSSGAFFTEIGEGSGQGLLAPYAPSMVASGPNYVAPPEMAPAPRSGLYAAIPAAVPLNAYAPRMSTLPQTPNSGGAPMPCNCAGNGNLQGIPWWAWALMAIGVVALFRRVT